MVAAETGERFNQFSLSVALHTGNPKDFTSPYLEGDLADDIDLTFISNG